MPVCLIANYDSFVLLFSLFFWLPWQLITLSSACLSWPALLFPFIGDLWKMIMYLQPIDKQSFLDSGILCCLIHVLNSLLVPDGGNRNVGDLLPTNENQDAETRPVRRLEVLYL